MIGLAMLGFAAGGTFASLAGNRWVAAARRRQELFPGLCLLCSVTTAASFLLVKRIPLDYLRFHVDGLQPLYLLASCILLSLLFLMAGLASCTASALEPGKSAAISCAGMLGSGAGALLRGQHVSAMPRALLKARVLDRGMASDMLSARRFPLLNLFGPLPH